MQPSFAQLGLTKDIKKTGIMSKTGIFQLNMVLLYRYHTVNKGRIRFKINWNFLGPSQSWINKWKRRVFVLKGKTTLLYMYYYFIACFGLQITFFFILILWTRYAILSSYFDLTNLPLSSSSILAHGISSSVRCCVYQRYGHIPV